MAATYSTLKKLEDSTGIKVRTWRKHLVDPVYPLPHFKLGGKILVRDEDFDTWIENYRVKSQNEVRGMVEDILKKQEGDIPADAASSLRVIRKGWEFDG